LAIEKAAFLQSVENIIHRSTFNRKRKEFTDRLVHHYECSYEVSRDCEEEYRTLCCNSIDQVTDELEAEWEQMETIKESLVEIMETGDLKRMYRKQMVDSSKGIKLNGKLFVQEHHHVQVCGKVIEEMRTRIKLTPKIVERMRESLDLVLCAEFSSNTIRRRQIAAVKTPPPKESTTIVKGGKACSEVLSLPTIKENDCDFPPLAKMDPVALEIGSCLMGMKGNNKGRYDRNRLRRWRRRELNSITSKLGSRTTPLRLT
jgi:hypothetical protein